jgi:hypothetical protein
VKKAIAILNRNMPDLTDDLVNIVSDIDADIFVLENGSQKERYSKHANLFETDSNGVAYGLNRLMQHCFDEGYDYIWINYNDARADDPAGFFDWSVSEMEKDPRIGVSAMHWGSIWDIYGRKRPGNWWDPSSEDIEKKLISFFDDLSFVISRKAIEATSNFDKRLTPFFDSSNYTNHYNLLAPAWALYESGMFMITNPNYAGIELDQAAVDNSVEARGYDDKMWKGTKGPTDAANWFNRFFPQMKEMNVHVKEKRNIIINQICQIYRQRESK